MGSDKGCIMVIFGATGDLTAKKLLPALYNMKKTKFLPEKFVCLGFARQDFSDESFRDYLKDKVNKHSRLKPVDEETWKSFSERIFYYNASFDDDNGYSGLKERMAGVTKNMGIPANYLFYLSVQPKFFPLIVEKLKQHGLIYEKDASNWSRVIIEKPFGHDLNSAIELQEQIEKNLSEDQIYRIDHYLGKETVQNLLIFRFANPIFESIWDSSHIDHVQISVAEDFGIGTRGRFYEEQGFVRDVLQNHMMQLLCLVAMESPTELTADKVRDEKVKVLTSIRPFSDDDLKDNCIRGQYGEGTTDKEKLVGYRQEENVDPNSNVETYVAVKLFIDNDRWTDVPFYLRGGKRLSSKKTEIALFLKKSEDVDTKWPNKNAGQNVIIVRVQPNEGISLSVNCKVPGPDNQIKVVHMDFQYSDYFGKEPPEAYERLIWEAIEGDGTLFARTDEVITSWKLLTPLLEYWKAKEEAFPNYKAGSNGPKASDDLIEKEGHKWIPL